MVNTAKIPTTTRKYIQHHLSAEQTKKANQMFGHLSETELSDLGKPKNSISALKNPISTAFQKLFQSQKVPQRIQN